MFVSYENLGSKSHTLFHIFAEEPYYGSGSGSGAGIDDEDGEEGSGSNPIDYDYDTEVRGHGNLPGGTKTVNTSSTHTGNAGYPSVVLKNEKENKVHIDHSNSSNTNKNSNSNTGSGAVGTIKLNSQMSLRRALFTYFLPIYLAWFGNIFSELL